MARLLIFGASGGVGQELVAQGLMAGHQISAFVRDPDRLVQRDPRLDLIVGDVGDHGSIASALPGHDAVLVALGMSMPRRPHPEIVPGVGFMVDAMAAHGPKRLVYLSSLGTPGTGRQLGWFVRNIIVPVFLRRPLHDHGVNERIISQSQLDWTIVRPPRLTLGPRTGQYRQGEAIVSHKLISEISRADVADFMIGEAVDNRYLRRAAAIMD